MPLPAATGATVNSLLGTQDGGATVARTPPSPDSSLQERMGFVHWQLDQFTGSQLLLGKYKSLGPAARRQGGASPPSLPRFGVQCLCTPPQHASMLHHPCLQHHPLAGANARCHMLP